MLGSLARKLRIFGFDCTYSRRRRDESLIPLAKRGRRTILTCDRGLSRFAQSREVRCLLLEGQNDREKLESLKRLARCESIILLAGTTRCPLCNRVLRLTPRRELSVAVSVGSLRHHRLFYECHHCGKAYWKGRHWRRLRSLSRVMGRKRI